MTARTAAAAAAARDTTAELAFATRALKAPTLRDAVPRLVERARAAGKAGSGPPASPPANR